MKFSRSASLPPVIITALFTLLLSACTTEEIQIPSDDEGMMQSSQQSEASSSAIMQSSEAAIVPKQKYEDGTFAAAGVYKSPAGMEEIEVSLILKNGVVSAASYEGKTTNAKSVKFQGLFEQGFTEAVVGASIDNLNLTVVNGSSLTPAGFMDALVKIKIEAAMKA
ncbi:hypothetical protein EXS65_00585 [Candidatus Peribacteria bacterium]|nr:hypothetical protein [Candidatus Peribacteria bacterium]